MGEKSNSDLALNPEPKRRRPSGSKFCLLILCLSLAFSSTFLVTCWLYSKDIRSPYAWVYQNETLDDVLDRSKVVQPLIDEQQRFDIVYSIWQRGGRVVKDELLRQSGVAFSNVTLKDKGLMTKIKLQIPPHIFKYQSLHTNFDLRATFSLVPASPSLLDNVVQTTSWIPESVKLPPVKAVNRKQKLASTLSDEIISQYSIHVPLVEFHAFDSYCKRPTSRRSLEDRVDVDDVPDGEFVYHTSKDSRNTGSHPYIVTRSHIRVVDFTQVLNLEEFNKEHQEFKAQSCGQNTPDSTASWYRCSQENDSFAGTGFWKTSLLKLGVPDENGVNHTEWAYSPYISAIRYPRGPLDLVPVPLCESSIYSFDVDWTVSYSGDSPFRTYLGDKIGSLRGSFDLQSDSSDRLHLDQLWIEYIHGLAYGQPYYEGHHKLMLTILENLSSLAEMADPILRLLYWYTRVSTVGSSLSGLLLLAISDVIHMILQSMFLEDIPTEGDIIGYLAKAFFVMGPVWVAVSFYKLKLAFRLEIKWNGVIPQLKMHRATHAERANSRMDSRLPWMIKILLILSLTFAFYHFQLVPLVDYDSLSATTVLRLLVYALFYTADISQIALNYHRGTFASMFKTASYLSVGNLALFTYVDQYLRGNTMDPINWFPIFLRVVMAIQAIRYPYAKDNLDDDE